jgi:hypothetical protein
MNQSVQFSGGGVNPLILIPEGTGFVIRNQVLLLKDCAVLHRVAVFFYRKGRRGFAEGAKASRPLRSLCARSPKAAGQALKTRNRAPFAKEAKPLRPLRSLCALCVTKTPQRGEKTRKFFPHNSRQNPFFQLRITNYELRPASAVRPQS